MPTATSEEAPRQPYENSKRLSCRHCRLQASSMAQHGRPYGRCLNRRPIFRCVPCPSWGAKSRRSGIIRQGGLSADLARWRQRHHDRRRLGQEASFETDWSTVLTLDQITALRPWLQVQGERAAAGPVGLENIAIPWRAAWEVFIRRSLPDQVKTARTAFDGWEASRSWSSPRGRSTRCLAASRCLGSCSRSGWNRTPGIHANTTCSRRQVGSVR